MSTEKISQSKGNVQTPPTESSEKKSIIKRFYEGRLYSYGMALGNLNPMYGIIKLCNFIYIRFATKPNQKEMDKLDLVPTKLGWGEASPEQEIEKDRGLNKLHKVEGIPEPLHAMVKADFIRGYKIKGKDKILIDPTILYSKIVTTIGNKYQERSGAAAVLAMLAMTQIFDTEACIYMNNKAEPQQMNIGNAEPKYFNIEVNDKYLQIGINIKFQVFQVIGGEIKLFGYVDYTRRFDIDLSDTELKTTDIGETYVKSTYIPNKLIN